jgi:hypothetical protein
VPLPASAAVHPHQAAPALRRDAAIVMDYDGAPVGTGGEA